MHEMLTILTNVRSVCLLDCLSASLLCDLHRWQCVQCTPLPCVWGHSVQPLSNYFDHLLFLVKFVVWYQKK